MKLWCRNYLFIIISLIKNMFGGQFSTTISTLQLFALYIISQTLLHAPFRIHKLQDLQVWTKFEYTLWGLNDVLSEGCTKVSLSLKSVISFPNNHFTLWSGQSKAVKVKTLRRGILAPHVAVCSISVLLNECGLRWRVWWSSWLSVGTFSAAGNSDWMPLIHVSVHRHF